MSHSYTPILHEGKHTNLCVSVQEVASFIRGGRKKRFHCVPISEAFSARGRSAEWNNGGGGKETNRILGLCNRPRPRGARPVGMRHHRSHIQEGLPPSVSQAASRFVIARKYQSTKKKQKKLYSIDFYGETDILQRYMG